MRGLFANFTKKNKNEEIKEIQRKTKGVDDCHSYILFSIRYYLGYR